MPPACALQRYVQAFSVCFSLTMCSGLRHFYFCFNNSLPLLGCYYCGNGDRLCKAYDACLFQDLFTNCFTDFGNFHGMVDSNNTNFVTFYRLKLLIMRDQTVISRMTASPVEDTFGVCIRNFNNLFWVITARISYIWVFQLSLSCSMAHGNITFFCET